MKNKIFCSLSFVFVVATYLYAFAGVTWFGWDFDQASFFFGIGLFIILLIVIPIWFKEEDEKQDSFPALVFICFMMWLLLSLVFYLKVFNGPKIASGLDIMISGAVGCLTTAFAFFFAAIIHDAVNSINYPNTEEDESS